MEVVSTNTANTATSLEIPGYRILKKINQGGMSTVYLAIQRSVGRQVALKVMSPVLNADPVFSERFQREANIVGQLSHPNIVGIHDIGRYRSLNYIAMDYMPGGSVSDRLSEGSIDPLEALNIIRQIATALDHAHGKGYVHRDLKPENILFREDGSAVLTDFGVARAIARTTRMTSTGMVVGTPHYMSPEQARGTAIDGRADLYSLGVVFYEMLAGAVPFQADEAVAIAIKHLTDPIPKLPARHSLYQSLIDRFLAKDPEQRFQRGLDVVDAIDQLIATLAGKPSTQATQLNNTSVRVSSLLRALLMTLYGTLSDQIAAAWARWRDKPLHENHPRAEQATIMRIHQVIQQAPPRKRRQWLFGGLVSVSLVFGWMLFSLIGYKLQWQSGSSLLDSASDYTASLLVPEQAPAAVPKTPLVAAAAPSEPEPEQEAPQAPLQQSIEPPAPLEEIPTTDTPVETARTEETEPETEESSDTIPSEEGTAAIKPVVETPKYRLTVQPRPRDARVRVMNINPRYRPGILLEPGKYDLEVSRPGYTTLRRWMEIKDSDLTVPVTLERAYYPGKKIRSPLPDGGTGPQMVVIGAGSFTMGNDQRDASSPAHRVTIGKPFAISTYEITFDEYDRYAKATDAALPGDAGWGRGDRPVINVSWRDARNYARWLSGQTGRRYRLASEAEWEYAARGGVSYPFWWGGSEARGKANCRRGCSSEFNGLFSYSSAPVGHYQANRFGLFDTAGNVAEWVEDCYLNGYGQSRNDGQPVVVDKCELRSVRGGSMREPLDNISSDYRTGLSEHTVSKTVGFRVVMELE
ncbi:bifunctional serine/threonine-protein kinase/formylglycine-generating enzyme family protein [Microbulbifer rhizosphaerae]|uniref:non-specific serine/threonine protein kinase n=1 Tax=Microbulbifer rhizosphaerae TaxID=1562603 RepID=A0A7W4WC00_9GAMM|nr:bifunctional serine/threonine-protein kinase/formylglycine-generating enzyme family protein [Microbulbifer rhizosphaerae]MBB3061470.1 serine/threonine-protein kinase PpkA [Microbulbifer rhizosphaerae]